MYSKEKIEDYKGNYIIYIVELILLRVIKGCLAS